EVSTGLAPRGLSRRLQHQDLEVAPRSRMDDPGDTEVLGRRAPAMETIEDLGFLAHQRTRQVVPPDLHERERLPGGRQDLDDWLPIRTDRADRDRDHRVRSLHGPSEEPRKRSGI